MALVKRSTPSGIQPRRQYSSLQPYPNTPTIVAAALAIQLLSWYHGWLGQVQPPGFQSQYLSGSLPGLEQPPFEHILHAKMKTENLCRYLSRKSARGNNYMLPTVIVPWFMRFHKCYKRVWCKEKMDEQIVIFIIHQQNWLYSSSSHFITKGTMKHLLGKTH